MFSFSKLNFFCLLLIGQSCLNTIPNRAITDQGFSLVDEILRYEKKPYSGILFSKTDSLKSYEAHYLNGKKHGKEQKFFFDGSPAELGYYTQGKKTGKHRAWWNKDQLKSEYHFDATGKQTGTQYQWFSNGQLRKEYNYNQLGQQEGRQREWNFSGKITANYVVIDGRKFGWVGSKGCETP